MELQLTLHTKERMQERGITLDEIADTIKTGKQSQASKGRYKKSKVFSFGKMRNGKIYPQKLIEVIYTIEDDTIIVITVYAFYGKWSKDENIL